MERYQYVYGNTVRKIEPERIQTVKPCSSTLPNKQAQKKAVHRNQSALDFDWRFCVFLAFASLCVVCACVFYLNGKATLQQTSREITRMQNVLYSLNEANTSKATYLKTQENLEVIRDRALELGMDYPTKGQIIYYDGPPRDHIKQYAEIPKDGILD